MVGGAPLASLQPAPLALQLLLGCAKHVQGGRQRACRPRCTPRLAAAHAAVFYEKKPAEVGPELLAAYVRAIQQLVPGARMGGGGGSVLLRRYLLRLESRMPPCMRKLHAGFGQVTNGSAQLDACTPSPHRCQSGV